MPRVALINDEYCCRGTVTIPVEKLDTYQRIPWGTPAWFARYARRNQIENVNGMLKDRRLENAWCRILNQTGNTLGLLTLAIAHNLRERKRYEHRLQQKRACQRRPVDTEPPADQLSATPEAARGPP